jgi:Tol biopolymer transport system component
MNCINGTVYFKMKRLFHPPIKILVLIGFLAFISGMTYFIWKDRTFPLPVLENGKSSDISMTSDLIFTFPKEMNKKSVEDRIFSNPKISFNYHWDENHLHLIPKTAFPPGGKVAILLEAGAYSIENERYSEKQEWTLAVRLPRIVFLGQPMTSPDIWIYDFEDRSINQVTRSGGKITSFNAFPDGSSILFSQKNDLNGSDIFTIKPDGTGEKKLIDCGKNTCRDAAIDRNSSKIAFSMNQNPENGIQAKTFYVFIYEISTGVSQALYPVHNIQGDFPSWSPDGKKIAVYDKNSLGIRIRNTEGANDFLLGTLREQTGAWSPDSSKFLFVDDITEESLTFSYLYEVDLQNSSISKLFKDTSGSEEFGTPAWSPDGISIAMGVRHIDEEVTKQLWLFDLEKKTRSPITTDSALTNAAQQWRPDGKNLVFQQAQLGSSGTKPSIVLWDKDSNINEKIADDGVLPVWLP